MNFNKIIDSKDFESNELKPYFELLSEIQSNRFAISNSAMQLDSRNWEMAMVLFSLDKKEVLTSGKMIVLIDSDHSTLAQILVRYGLIVFSISPFFGVREVGLKYTLGITMDPSSYFPGNTNTKNIISINSDLRVLSLPSNFFDAVYLSGSSSNFSDSESFQSCVAEVSRILKPGGYASVSANFFLDGPEHTSIDLCKVPVLNKDFLYKKIVQFSGLNEVDLFKTDQSSGMFENRRHIVNFLDSDYDGLYSDEKGLVRYSNGFLFSSAHLFLSKPIEWKQSNTSRVLVENFQKKIQHEYSLIEKTQYLSRNSHQSLPNIDICNKIIVSGFFKSLLVITNDNLNNFPKIKNILIFILRRIPFIYTYLRKLVSNKKVDRGILAISIRAAHSTIKSSRFLHSISMKYVSRVPGLLSILRKKSQR